VPRLPAVTPERFAKIAFAALVALTVIVLTGAAVRLTDSGLGCPDWPRCYGRAVPPLSYHSVIEFGNRVFSGLIGVFVVITWIAALLRTPRRRDLTVLATLLPLGVVAQAVLGGFTVRHQLAPGFVMGHYGLSMLVLIPAVALAWRARHAPGTRPLAADALTVWVVRLAAVIGSVVLFAGTVATAAGPHAGGTSDELIHRLHFKGATTLTWVIHRHATIATLLGLTVIGAWLLVRRRGGNPGLLDTLTLAGVLMAAQGLVGSVQYELQLPADIVWVHVTLASITWAVLLWAVACAGRLGSTRVALPDASAEHGTGEEPQLEVAARQS
jgi:heme a synthase